VAAMIAEAATLVSSRRKVAAAADNEMLALSTAVAVAVSASAAAASDASGEKISSSTTGGDDTASDISSISWSGAAPEFWRHRMTGTVTDNERVEGNLEIAGLAVPEMRTFKADAEATLQIDAADAANAPIMDADTDPIHVPDHHTIELAAQSRGDKLDRPVSATSEEKSAENEFIAGKPPSDNGNDSAFQFKPNFDHHASADPKIGDVAKAKDQPAQSDNFKFKFADDDEGHATGKDKSSVAKIKDDTTGKDKSADNDHHASADLESSNSAVNDGGLLPVTDAQPDNFKFADEGNPGKASHDLHAKEIGDNTKAVKDHPAHPHSENFKFKFADDAHPGNDKLDMIETDRTVTADIQLLLHTAQDANAVNAADPNPAAQDMTKVQPHHHADLHA
jgi:hypothetical protein